jgi:hypothetical protein
MWRGFWEGIELSSSSWEEEEGKVVDYLASSRRVRLRDTSLMCTGILTFFWTLINSKFVQTRST